MGQNFGCEIEQLPFKTESISPILFLDLAQKNGENLLVLLANADRDSEIPRALLTNSGRNCHDSVLELLSIRFQSRLPTSVRIFTDYLTIPDIFSLKSCLSPMQNYR